jgi:hypothetical protein
MRNVVKRKNVLLINQREPKLNVSFVSLTLYPTVRKLKNNF